MKQAIFVLLTFMLSSPCVFAQCPPDCPPEEGTQFNSDNPTSFDYVNGDFSAITDWSNVEWSRIPPTKIAQVPVQELKYYELSLEQRLEMSSEQIGENFDHIEDLTKDVNIVKAENAVKQKYDLGSVSLGKGAKIENDLLHTTYGTQDYLPLKSLNSQVKVIVNEQGRIEVYGEPKPSSQGQYTAVYLEETVIELSSGEKINVKGNFNFREGEIYLRKDVSEARTFEETINGIRISPPIRKERSINGEKYGEIRIFLDGKKHEGDYISISDQDIQFSLLNQKDKQIELRIPSNHPIFNTNIESKNEKIITYNIELSGGSLGAISKRGIDGEGRQLVPLMEFTVPAQGYGIGMSLGTHGFYVTGGKFIYSPDFEIKKSPLLTIIGKDVEGNDIFSDEEEPKKAVLTPDGFVVLALSYPAEEFECVGCHSKAKSSNLILSNSYAYFQKEKIKITGELKDDPMILSSISYYVASMPEDVRDSIRTIDILNKPGNLDCVGASSACTWPGGKIVVSKTVSQEQIQHEAVHARHLEIMDSQSGEIQQLARDIATDKENSILGFSPDNSLREKKLETLRKESFNSRWNSFIIDPSEYLGPPDFKIVDQLPFGYSMSWKEKESDGPEIGFMTAYGANNLHTASGGLLPFKDAWFEDVATVTENINKGNYKAYQKVIDPSSSYYQERLGKPIVGKNSRVMTSQDVKMIVASYKGKLGLLQEYGFITTKDYCKVIKDERCQ